MAIKAFLMQNLSLIALLVLEIWRHKISLGIRERVMKFGYLPPENGFNFKKMSFYVQNRSSRSKIDPHVNFSNFQAWEKIFIFKIFGTSRWEKSSSNPPGWPILLKCGQKVSQGWKLKVTKFRHHRIRGLWLAAVSLAIRASEPPPPGPDRVKRCRANTKWTLLIQQHDELN